MKLYILPIITSLLLSCKTVATPKNEDSDTLNSTGQRKLSRVIGELTKNEPRSFEEKCDIFTTQIEDMEMIQKLIDNLASEKPTVGYPFVAFVPSREYYYYENEETKFIARFHSTIESKPSGDALVKIIDEICKPLSKNSGKKAKK